MLPSPIDRSRPHAQPNSLALPDPSCMEIGRSLPGLFAQAPIRLIPQGLAPTAEHLERHFPEAKRIFAVDFYVQGAELGRRLDSGAGYELGGRICNIDHHAPDARWERCVSSGNLACLWVRAHGAVTPESGDVIVINHTDCDSVIASLILAGALPPHPRFEEAVLDADHRGLANEIADLLQSGSSSRDLPWLVGSLSRALQGEPHDAQMRQRLDALEEKRLYVRGLLSNGSVVEKKGVFLVQCQRQIDSDLFVSVFRDARAVVIGCRSDQFPDLNLTRIRLGPKAPEGLSLHKLGVSDLDPYYGGRYNAGSNKRGLEESLAAGRVPSRIVSAQEHFESLLANLPA
jgi:hypothetical protein